MGFPKGALVLSLKACALERWVSFEGIVAQPIWPGRSIVAGDGAATRLLRAFMFVHVHTHDQSTWGTTLTLWVDDATVSKEGTEEGAAQAVAEDASRLCLDFTRDQLQVSKKSEAVAPAPRA